MFTLGAVGFIILDIVNESKMAKSIRAVMLFAGVVCVITSLLSVRAFMKIKMP